MRNNIVMKKILILFYFVFLFVYAGFTQSNSSIDLILGGGNSHRFITDDRLLNTIQGTTTKGIYGARYGLNYSRKVG